MKQRLPARWRPRRRPGLQSEVSGESHYFLGRRYRLRIHEHGGPARVALHGIASLDIFVRHGSTPDLREAQQDDAPRFVPIDVSLLAHDLRIGARRAAPQLVG